MRKCTAFSLLALFSWMLIVPLLAPGADANLPLCCRRHGKHHCAMMEVLTGLRPGIGSLHERCPFAHQAKAAAHSSPPQAAPAFWAALPRPSPLALRNQIFRSLTLDRSPLQRGPPPTSCLS